MRVRRTMQFEVRAAQPLSVHFAAREPRVEKKMSEGLLYASAGAVTSHTQRQFLRHTRSSRVNISRDHGGREICSAWPQRKVSARWKRVAEALRVSEGPCMSVFSVAHKDRRRLSPARSHLPRHPRTSTWTDIKGMHQRDDEELHWW